MKFFIYIFILKYILVSNYVTVDDTALHFILVTVLVVIFLKLPNYSRCGGLMCNFFFVGEIKDI